MRSQQEILDRMKAVAPGDWLGVQQTDLAGTLDFEHVKPFLKPGVTEWTPVTLDDIREEATTYLEFAVGKALDHRGISANRSIDHYRAWLWLLELDEGFEDTPYEMYGAPMLTEAARRLGVELPLKDDDERQRFERMAQGGSCGSEYCDGGCMP